MPDISMQREHALGADEVRANIAKLAAKLADRLGGSWSWEGNIAVCEARGATARVAYDDQRVSIEVTLPRAYKPFRGRLKLKIEESFNRYFRPV